MKTLAVLSALATLAIAAPAPDQYTDTARLSPSSFTITQQREKKATHLETQQLEDVSSKFGPSHFSGRTFSGFKKPIIVKKKIGYQLYRDSDEEQSQADPGESCRKQIKVKLCDDNNSMDKIKSASIDHTHDELSELEMEHSINMAKEAVETFQRDLQKMEHNSVENTNHRHAPLGSDTELHEDIEKARQALEHIHRKFKNLDSALTNEDERISNIHSKTLRNDEDRMAQWKGATNLHKSVEIGRNLEDNFKSINDEKDEKKLFKNALGETDTTSNLKTKMADGLEAIVEDKVSKMNIQSDNLIKENTKNESDLDKEEKPSGMNNQENIEKTVETNDSENINHHLGSQQTKEEATEDKEVKFKSVELQGHNLNVLEQQLSRNNDEHSKILKVNDDAAVSDGHARLKLEQELHKGHSNTKSIPEENSEAHDSKTITNLNNNSEKTTRSEEAKLMNEGVTTHLNHHHIPSLKGDDNKNTLHTEMNLQRSPEIEAMGMKSELISKKIEENNIDPLRSSASMPIATFDAKDGEKIHHANNEMKNGLTIPMNRASSALNKELLNNMEFVVDSHHNLAEAGHVWKNEKSELHERFNVPSLAVQPNSEHLHTMMHFSDSAHRISPQLKMNSMFNNEEPNINVQLNNPQEFEEETNVQQLMPFKAADEMNEKNLHNAGFKEGFNTILSKDHNPTELHDPLKIRWAHDNNVHPETLQGVSQFHADNMRMDASAQHFNIEKMPPSRSSLMNDHHLSLNEQMRAQQLWAQAKSMNTHQSSPMNSGFHAHDHFLTRNNDHNMMIHGKPTVDSNMQPSSFTQLKGTPKMALEYTNPNQWSHNHGAFRSSYGPGMSASYGSGSGTASGGSAVGVFPNANVGNCAVPLLLSCSPSVVSGSLAKAQPSQSAYGGAPSYRSEDINFLKKRGIDIDDISPGLKLQRLTPLGHGTNLILEKKQ